MPMAHVGQLGGQGVPVPVELGPLRGLVDVRHNHRAICGDCDEESPQAQAQSPCSLRRIDESLELPTCLRSRQLHQAVAHKLIRDPGLLEFASARLDKPRAANPSARRYHARWNDLIAGPRTNRLRALTEDSESAADLRKESPFTTLLAPDERKRVLQRLAS